MTRRFSQDFWKEQAAGDAVLRGPSFELPAAVEPPPDEAARATVHHALHPDGQPVAIYVPEGYERNYAYPLIVWLHGAGGSERELAIHMPAISTRNYLALAPRAPLSCAAGDRDWELSDADAVEATICEIVRRFRREYHVHSERVFLAGFDSGAATALRLLLRRPEWYGGAAAFGGGLPRSEAMLARYRHLRGKRVLLAAGAHDPVAPRADLSRSARLLHTAGMHVTFRTCRADHRVTPRMLSHLNRWVMEGIGAVV